MALLTHLRRRSGFMLRFVSLLIVRMLIFLSGVGLLVSHAWGWNEYASAELYVVYFQLIEGKPHYFIVSADGSSASESLNWDEGGIAALDCSPDGRTFAFLSGSRHVYVINRGGLVHDRPADALYTTINVANDGTLALFDPTDARLLVNDRMIDLATAERKGNAFDRVDISAQGLVLWMQDFADIQLVSLATGSVLPTVPHGYSGQWITSGQMFIFADQVTDAEGNWINGGQYLLDVATRRVARIGDWTLGSPLSPDNTKVAVAVPITHLNHNTAQVAVFSIFREQERVLLTHDTQTASQPICFLTFRPQMLIS